MLPRYISQFMFMQRWQNVNVLYLTNSLFSIFKFFWWIIQERKKRHHFWLELQGKVETPWLQTNTVHCILNFRTWIVLQSCIVLYVAYLSGIETDPESRGVGFIFFCFAWVALWNNKLFNSTGPRAESRNISLLAGFLSSVHTGVCEQHD